MDYSSNVDASLVEGRKDVPDASRVGRGLFSEAYRVEPCTCVVAFNG